MIDSLGIIVDKTKDGGDSCNFTCTAIYLGLYDDKPELKENVINLFWNNGQPVRHPSQYPWNNPNNFTRDQAIPLMQVIGLNRIKEFLNKYPTFFPNVERDKPGSKKKWYPHKFYKDSNPDTTTVPILFPLQPKPKTEIEYRLLDGPDLITMDFKVMCEILCGETPGKYRLSLAKFLCSLSIKDHCNRAKKDRTYTDFKQLYFTAKALGMHHVFAEQHPWGLHYAAETYFTKQRELPEITAGFFKEFAKEGIK